MDNQPVQNPNASDTIPRDTQTSPIAMPYTPPPPPTTHYKNPLVRRHIINMVVFGLVILLGGFMTYNFVVHQMTQLAGESTEKHITKPTPTVTPIPTIYQGK